MIFSMNLIIMSSKGSYDMVKAVALLFVLFRALQIYQTKSALIRIARIRNSFIPCTLIHHFLLEEGKGQA